MSSMRTMLLVAIVLGVAAVAQARDVCEIPCVKQLYLERCGSTVCVFGYDSLAQKDGLCTDTCRSAFAGTEFTDCLATEQDMIGEINQIKTNFLGLLDSACGTASATAVADTPSAAPVAAPTVTTTPVVTASVAVAPGAEEADAVEAPFDGAVETDPVVAPVVAPVVTVTVPPPTAAASSVAVTTSSVVAEEPEAGEEEAAAPEETPLNRRKLF